MAFYLISGPRDAGPGERALMFDRADAIFAESGIAAPERIDVTGRDAAESADSQLRESVQRIVPALQSGSLFGGASGVLVVDSQNLLKAEAEIIAELLKVADPESVTAVFLSSGKTPAPVAKVLKERGEAVSIKKMRERDAVRWLAEEARDRKLRLEPEAGTILVRHYGSDIAALGQALDQLAVDGSTITAETVEGRYVNRPDEPMWLLADAISEGKEGEALRRLADFLQHGHPLVVLSFLEGEVKRRSLAAIAPDVDTYASWVNASPQAYPVKKVWQQRSRTRSDSLRRSLDALARADLQIKTAPEETHRVTLERLTVAMCRWLGK
jgi:DNA polymerase III delta subunit